MLVICNWKFCKLSLSLLITYDWVLNFRISNKSNKQVMLGVTSGSELFSNRKNQTEKKGNAM